MKVTMNSIVFLECDSVQYGKSLREKAIAFSVYS
jgi:hypothetical protein